MKKTLITLLAFAGVALGEVTLFTNLSDTTSTVNGITYAPGDELEGLPFTDGVSIGTFTNTSNDIGGTYRDKAAITVAFTLNLTQALLTTTQVDLIGISGNSGDVGLTLLSDGKAQGKWNGGVDGNARMDLSGLSSYAYTVGEESFVTLTLTASKPNGNGGKGVQVYVNDGTCVFNHASLATNNNTSFDAITVNTSLISSIAIDPSYPEIVDAGAANYAAAAIGRALQAAVIPEPTTVTLSLLALAGLAARRRRK